MTFDSSAAPPSRVNGTRASLGMLPTNWRWCAAAKSRNVRRRRIACQMRTAATSPIDDRSAMATADDWAARSIMVRIASLTRSMREPP